MILYKKMIPNKILDKVYVNFITHKVLSKTKHKVMDLDKFVKKYDDPNYLPEKTTKLDIIPTVEINTDFDGELCYTCGSLKQFWKVKSI